MQRPAARGKDPGDSPERPQWSVILPVHNQADHLHHVVSAYCEALNHVGESFEMLLVPNGCTDESESVCRQLAAEHEQIRIVACPTAGWGAAVRAGLAQCTGDTICYTNLARTTPEDLMRVLDTASRHQDSAVKARREVRESAKRKVGSHLYNLEARVLFGIRTPDINGTPKAFPRRYTPLVTLRSDDDLIDLEFMAQCQLHGYPLLEVAIESTRRHGGTSTTGMKSAVKMYTGAFRLRRNLDRHGG